MKKLHNAFVLLLISFTVSAQYGYRDSNRIGINVGVNQFRLNTNNFLTKPELGWNGGFSIRGNFYNNWDMVYGIQFSENNFSVATINKVFVNEDVNLKLASAQISLQLSYVVVENSLSFEFGPIVQVGGKFKSESDKENNSILGTTLVIKDIQDISKFNFYTTAGVTAGLKHFRFNISYQYGINNMLENLNTKNLGYNFKGNPGIVNGNIILYL
jgi:hypothetical protein